MTNTQLRKRIESLRSWFDACVLAAALHGTRKDSNGTLAECFLAGWVNTADMIDAGTIDNLTGKRVTEDDFDLLKQYICSETNNMYGVKVK